MRKAFMLPTTLILLMVLLISGMAFLGSRVLQYRGSTQSTLAAQALALAEAGMEETRIKLQKDLVFPPPLSDEQLKFTLAEDYPDPVTGAPAGYEVTVDMSWADPPHSVLRITATGIVGPRGKPLSRRVLSAEYDLAVQDRANPAAKNPTVGRYIHWVDGGDL